MAQQNPVNYSQQDKWGIALNNGFVVVPSALFLNQSKIGISDGEVLVLLNLIMAWREVGTRPFPRTTTLAKRMGVTVRTVQRHVDQLEAKGLISRVKIKGGRTEDRAITEYGLSGIVTKLQELGSKPQVARETSASFPASNNRVIDAMNLGSPANYRP